MSISRCARCRQIFAYVKQAPTPFEVLLNRLPHFTTDTLSHSGRRSSIWSCNMNTCIQTQEHSRHYKVIWTLLTSGFFPYVNFFLGVKGLFGTKKKKSSLWYSTSIYLLLSYFLHWLTRWLSCGLGFSFLQPAFFRDSRRSPRTFDHTPVFPPVSLCVHLSRLLLYILLPDSIWRRQW